MIGEAGVGKSAIVEGLALRIARGEVPYTIADKTLFSLDVSSLVAGTKFRGEFEERMQQLLDELRKPYVVTARAKGVRPLKLLFKYPVRMALNPFISGIGTLFPTLVSGSSIVAIVMSLPTVGPLMLSALFSQDMNMAGSMLMVLSLLGVMGTLVSDLLLMMVDPRIRLEGGGTR